MVEILYRIYRVRTQEERKKSYLAEGNSFSIYGSYSNSVNEEVLMDCWIGETRDLFKESLRLSWGPKLAFRYSKNLKENSYYCIIIGEHCFNTERYFNRVEYTCAECGAKVISWIGKSISLDSYDIRSRLANQFDKYQDLKFCCLKCRSNYLEKEIRKIKETMDVDESWISRDDFRDSKLSGYIYKITKKSTGEFYIGQTIYVPVFRWGQHLKTNRFTINNLLDYQFEVIEKVPIDQNILEREKYWIQEYYKSWPEKSLNISQTKNIEL